MTNDPSDETIGESSSDVVAATSQRPEIPNVGTEAPLRAKNVKTKAERKIEEIRDDCVPLPVADAYEMMAVDMQKRKSEELDKIKDIAPKNPSQADNHKKEPVTVAVKGAQPSPSNSASLSPENDDSTFNRGQTKPPSGEVAPSTPRPSFALEHERGLQGQSDIERASVQLVTVAWRVTDDNDDEESAISLVHATEIVSPWKRFRSFIFGGMCALLIGIIVAVGVLVRGSSNKTSDVNESNQFVPSVIAPSVAPSLSLLPSMLPTMLPSSPPSSPKDCFSNKIELQVAIELYIAQGCTVNSSCEVGKKYGWPIGIWCTSEVTDMSELFQQMTSFNEDLSGWDMSSVTDANHMFNGATSFNGDIGTWNTSSLTNMNAMFAGATSFNSNIGSWDVASVIIMESAFYESISFNQDLNKWDVSSVTTMFLMFYSAKMFNGDISSWNTSSVMTMTSMFSGASSFNREIGNWDLSSVTGGTNQMFFGATLFNADISLWDVSNVRDMNGMFYEAAAFDGDISAWGVSSVFNMEWMFKGATLFNCDISSWNVSSATTMLNMLYYATTFNQDLCLWGNKFPYGNASGIFEGSGCTVQDEPQLDQQGPFCASRCN
ncbi:hypothetical protein ACHAW6_009929 [Cyclotella cf. meneghiniana]